MGDSPGQSGPSNAVRASLKPPVLMPLRYSQGISSSMLFALRRYGGRIFDGDRPPIVHPRHGHLQRSDARNDRAWLGVAVADNLPMALPIRQVAVARDPRRRFGFDRLNKQVTSSTSQDVGQGIVARQAAGWKRKRFGGNVLHGGVLLARVGDIGCCDSPRVRRLSRAVIHRI